METAADTPFCGGQAYGLDLLRANVGRKVQSLSTLGIIRGAGSVVASRT
jgi:hypothetical protein